MEAEQQTDKFSLVARAFMDSRVPLRLPVDQNWPEFLKRNEDGWERTAAEGFNVFELMRIAGSKGYESPFWMMLRDGESSGGKLRPGAEGVTVALWRWREKSPDWEGDITPKNVSLIQESAEFAEGGEKVIAMRPVVIFNAAQWDEIDSWPSFEKRIVPTKEEALENAQKIESVGTGCEIRHEGTIPYYNPSLNYICVPPLTQVGAKAYYWMLFEQIGHAAASRHQLNIWGEGVEAGLAKEDPSVRVFHAKMVAARLAYETGIDVLE